MTKENPEGSSILLLQRIYVTWNNGASGVYQGAAVLTPEEMNPLNPKRPKITSVKVGKPFVLGLKEQVDVQKDKDGKEIPKTKEGLH